MNASEARQAAADYLEAILEQAYECVDLDILMESFEVELEDAMSILFEIGSSTVSVYWTDHNGCICEDEDPLANAQVGDPDPTNEVGDDVECCAATDGRWLCTREDGHSGVHVAGDGIEVCGVWE